MALTDEQRKKKMAYDDDLHKRTLDRIVIQPRKEEQLPARIDLAISAGLSTSRQAYIINAVKKALEADGIPEITEE